MEPRRREVRRSESPLAFERSAAMNVLLIGSGGREHALAWKLSASPLLSKLYCAPGNGGIAEVAECVPLAVADHTAVIRFCADNSIDLVIVGPEAPLVAGLVDDLTTAGIKCFGPKQAAAQLEGSKGFTKDLCAEFGIPTAAYGRFTDAAGAKAYLDRQKLPIVVKADGLAAGKGVTIAATRGEAEAAIDACLPAPSARPATRSSSRSSWKAKRRASSRSSTANMPSPSSPPRITSASARATPDPTRAAWALTRRPPS